MSSVSVRDATSDNLGTEVLSLPQGGLVLEGVGSGDERLRQTYRTLARNSLYFLAKGVLGYKDVSRRTHKPICDFVQDPTNLRTLVLQPRSTYKTTIGTISYSIFYLLNNPDGRVLIANQVIGNAEIMLQEIEMHLDGSNAMMNWLFPEYIKPHERWKPWSQESMMVPCRRLISGTPSIMIIGTGGRVESRHFDVIINDDLVGEKAMSSDKEMMDAITWHDYSVSLFVDPSVGIERMYGTRWSLTDLYSVVMKDPEYKTMLRHAIDPETNQLFFPEKLNHETLTRIRDRNYAHYMSQYMNDPENPEALEFRKDWLRIYSLEPRKNRNGVEEPACVLDGKVYMVSDMDVILVVDPAGSGDADVNMAQELKKGRARKSNNAVGVVGFHGSGLIFLIDLWAGRAMGENPELEVAHKIFQLAQRWKGYLRKGYVEAYGAQAALITIFNMVCRDNNFSFPMDEIPRGVKKAKPVRIRGAVGGPAQNRQICVRPHHDQFIYEFSKWPMAGVNDCLDMMAWAIIMGKRPLGDSEIKVRKESDDKFRRVRLRMIGRGGY